MSYELNDFESQVLERSRHIPVLVDFWAPWCAPCRALSPVLEKLAAAAADRWEFIKVNTEEHPDLASRYEIRSIPNVKLFHGGAVVDEFMGALPESEIRRWLQAKLPSPNAELIQEAESLFREQQWEKAATLLQQVLEAEPDRHEIRLRLGELWLRQQPERVAEVLEPIPLDSDHAQPAAALRVLSDFRTVKAPLEPALNPELHSLRQAAAAALQEGDFDTALGNLIQVLERSKADREGATKEVCKAIIQYLGIRHPVIEKYHRAFTSALYA